MQWCAIKLAVTRITAASRFFQAAAIECFNIAAMVFNEPLPL
jgi:hypothetical protein